MKINLYQINNLPLFQFKNLNNATGLLHGISTRKGGISEDNYSTLNLSYMVKDDPTRVKHNREIIATTFKVSMEHLKIPAQVHGNRVLVIDNNTTGEMKADALITNDDSIALAVLLADCVPVLVYDPKNRVIAAIHAGWRGTVAKIVTATIDKMKESFQSNPDQLIAGIGPSIGPEVYEVGPEVKEAADDAFETGHGSIEEHEGKLFFNLWKANQLQLQSAGVPPHNIETAEICTYQNSETFYSARKIKPVTGRFAAVIKLI